MVRYVKFIFGVALQVILPTIALADDTEAQYRLSRQCGLDAERYFKEELSHDITADYSNHYSKMFNACYIVVSFTAIINGHANNISFISALNEHNVIGSYSDEDNRVLKECKIGKFSCGSRDEFLELTKRYMEN